MKLNFKWKENTEQYQSGESLYLNRLLVGGYGWNASRSRDESKDSTKNYVGQTTLPQATKSLYGENTDEIKTKIEHRVTAWFGEAFNK